MPKYNFTVRSDDKKEREKYPPYGFSAEYEIEADGEIEAIKKGTERFISGHPDKNLNDYSISVDWSQ